MSVNKNVFQMATATHAHQIRSLGLMRAKAVGSKNRRMSSIN
jgi:hypothetical protein